MAAVWPSIAKRDTSSSIYSGLKKRQGCKAKGFEEQNGTIRWSVKLVATSKSVKRYSGSSGHCFANITIQLILFLYVIYCSVFHLVAFFILCAIRLGPFFNISFSASRMPA